jgi:hypothetical protein
MNGFVHGDYSVGGLVQEIDWGEWQSADQKSFAFGVQGSSVINGGLAVRRFSFPMMVWGYGDAPTRDAALFQLELNIGVVAGLTVTVGYGTIVNIPNNVRLASVVLGKSGVDFVHQYFRQLFLMFEQLQPPPVIIPDPGP